MSKKVILSHKKILIQLLTMFYSGYKFNLIQFNSIFG